jgi:hypothetical protein
MEVALNAKFVMLAPKSVWNLVLHLTGHGIRGHGSFALVPARRRRSLDPERDRARSRADWEEKLIPWPCH